MPDNTPQKASPSYRLATDDPDFLLRDEMRPQRFALEFAKADYALRDWGVRSTVVVFGSARIPSPEHAATASPPLRALAPWYQTARDFARFGEFYRQDGVWAGRRMLPEGWVTFARTPTVEKAYGAGFWLEAPPGHIPPTMMNGQGPLDAFSCQGHGGQVVLIVPSKKLVVTRLALMADDDPAWARLGHWLAPIVNAFPNA